MKINLSNPQLSPPRLLQRTAIALNVEGTSARLLLARANRVLAWGEVPLESGLVKEGVIADPQAVGIALKTLLDSHRALGGQLIASVTGLRSIPRILELPKMKPQMMEAAVAREAKREMPVPLDDIYLSWQPLAASNGQQRIFALGVPRDTLDPLLRAIAVTGKRAYAVDIKPLALARAVDRREAIIADIEPESADIVVVTGGIPAIMRTVVSRGDGADVEGSIDRCRGELARTIKFYNDTHRQEPLAPSTPLFFTGSLAQEAAAAIESVEGLAPYPVEAVRPPLECPPDLPIASYAVNIGLAAKGV
jgi:type IV pilus assembly protein PilM